MRILATTKRWIITLWEWSIMNHSRSRLRSARLKTEAFLQSLISTSRASATVSFPRWRRSSKNRIARTKNTRRMKNWPFGSFIKIWPHGRCPTWLPGMSERRRRLPVRLVKKHLSSGRVQGSRSPSPVLKKVTMQRSKRSHTKSKIRRFTLSLMHRITVRKKLKSIWTTLSRTG